jgi:O-antigen/teichoic acid export membrane protein
MGIIRRQGIQSSILIYLGFALGAFNILILFPRFLSTEQAGLIFLFVALSKIIFGFATLGNTPLMNKFFPYYDAFLSKRNNDFLTTSFILPIIGFFITTLCLIFFKDFFIRKSIERSPLVADYYWWIIPFCLFFILYSTLETYSSTKYKTVVPSLLREIGVRLLTTLLIIGLFVGLYSFPTMIVLYSLIFMPLAIALIIYLAKTDNLYFNFQLSKVTKRLKSHMGAYGAYVYGGILIGAIAENADVLIIGSLAGLGNVAVYQTGHFVATIIQVPYRSLSAISAPLLAQAWKDKNIELIETIYKKTSINQLLAALFLFGLIWVNIDFILYFLGEDFTGVKEVVFLLGLARVIDLGFGQNAEVLHNSKYWRFNFLSYVILVLIFLPSNYILVKYYGIIGSALSNLVSFLLFNFVRFVFIYKKIGLQPFTLKSLLSIAICIIAVLFSGYLAVTKIQLLTVILQSVTFILVFSIPVLSLKVSEDINAFAKTLLQKFVRIKQ